MASYLITGASRGVGLELARQLVAMDVNRVSKVVATTRGAPPEELNDLISTSNGRVIHVACDITVSSSIEKAVSRLEGELKDGKLDVLINNAGMTKFHPKGIHTMPDEDLQQVLDANVIGAHRMTAALLPFLRKGEGKKVINMSTTLGSIKLAPNFAFAPTPAYKISKAALNMLTVQYAQDYAKEGFTIISLSPGWMKTEIGTSYADLDVETGVRASLEIITQATPEMNGKFYNIHLPGWEVTNGPNSYPGGEVPW